MEIILNEFLAIPYLLLGLVIVVVGIFISDTVTNAVDRFWKKDH